MLVSAYKMKVTITDPNTEVDMFSSLSIILHCKFYYDKSINSLGYYVEIEGKEFLQERYILGYFNLLSERQQIKWIENWARNYWDGKDDTWTIKTLEIEKE